MDIITGLDLGGDDYITKPFKLGVLLSRVHALLRRAGGFGAQQATELCSGGIRVDLLAGRAEKNGVPLELTAAEYKLLCPVSAQPGAGADQRDHSERPVGLRGQLCRYQHPHGVHPAAAAQGGG